MNLKIKVSDFDLSSTLDSGQVFGFEKNNSGYQGIVRGEKVILVQSGSRLMVSGQFRSNFRKELHDFFDLDYDLKKVLWVIDGEESFGASVQTIRGLRLIHQDSWEALACFIISSNNNVKRIQGIWKNLTKRLSSKPDCFPSVADIARSHERILRELGLGYRAPFLYRAASFLSHNPKCLEVICEAPYQEAKRRLLAFPGIGEKVADCALLYGFRKLEAFPVDIWILRVMRKLFFKNKPVSEDRIRSFGQKRWGELAGYVQQYLFHGARMGLIQ